MQSRRVFAVIFLILALVFLVFGIVQVCLFAIPQFSMLSDATAQGADPQEVSRYISESVTPQIFMLSIDTLFKVVVVAGIGLLFWGPKRNKQLESLLASHSSKQAQSAPAVAATPAAVEAPAVSTATSAAVAVKPAAVPAQTDEATQDKLSKEGKAEAKPKAAPKKPATAKPATDATEKPKATPKKKPTAKKTSSETAAKTKAD